MAIIASEIDGLYRSNKRNGKPILQYYGTPLRRFVDVTTILTAIIISSIADHSSLLDHHVILHAALVAALYRIIGVEFGPYFKATASLHPLKLVAAAYCVQEAVSSYLSHYQAAQSSDQSRDDGEIRGKECTNLMVLLCELYNFQVISCILVYDLIRWLLSSVVGEMDVEILLKILRSMCYYLSFRHTSNHWLASGTQLRRDDPLALRDIVLLVNERVAGRQASMRYFSPSEHCTLLLTCACSSRTKFMLEALTNLKNNKNRKLADGPGSTEVVERMKKFLSGLGRTQHRTHRLPRPY